MEQGKTKEELLKWFQEDVLPKRIKEGRFPVPGVDPQDLVQSSLIFEETLKGTDHFASTPYFLRLNVQHSNDPSLSKEFHLVVKFITQNIPTRISMETDVQFYNEMAFYNDVLPTMKKFLSGRKGVSEDFFDEIFPVCRYAHMDLSSPDYGIVIMDDLRQGGFATAASKVELELDYVLRAVESLAKFHAVSYAMKLEEFPGFEKMAKSFIECRYQSDNDFKTHTMGEFHQLSASRAIDYLLSKGDSEVPAAYLKSLKVKVTSAPFQLMQQFIKPKEPLAIICHGDFCRNNILFHLENGRAVDSRLFDLQTWRYGNPSIDLSFFICMNTTLELREQHFDEIIQTYHAKLINTVANIMSKETESISSKLPLELFLKDFGDHAWYGYMIVAFFLPMMMAPKNTDFEEEWTKFTPTEMAENNAKQGGDVVSKRIAEVIVDFYRRGFNVV